MAKILVADDNSNIQKMVGLALKDQGIDVVAVGNGEAAVRKISDVRPDLVLADVFMPVRNGYEVCQYVKADSALAHIPVILLVGAFDPLDEQEAQRVGADGVLKKPFVPPEPLISMVKSALVRAGVPVGGAAPPPPAPEVQAADMLTPRFSSLPKTLGSIEPFDFPGHAPMVSSEPVQDALPGRPEPVKIDSGSQPLAFGSLLGSSATEEEEDLSYASPTRTTPERDWKSGTDEEEVEEEEEEPTGSWRRDGGDDSFAEQETTDSEEDWKEPAFSETRGGGKKHREPWAPGKEKSNFVEAAEVDDTQTAYAQTTSPSPSIPPAPFAGDSWAAPLSQKRTGEAATTQAPAPPKEKPAAQASVPAPEVMAPAPVPVPEKSPASTSWYSTVASPWDAEVQKATRLASTWDTSAVVASAPPKKEDPTATVDSLPSATVKVIRDEAQQVAETAAQDAPAARANSGTPKTPEPSVDELVAKVLSRMSPDVLQAVTREILKPVVEAMVRDELSSKN